MRAAYFVRWLLLLVFATLLPTGRANGAEADASLADLIVELLGDADADIRALGLEQIRTQAPGEAATRRFAEQLPALSGKVKIELIRALSSRGDSAARDAIVDLLDRETEPAVRAAAIQSLGPLGGPQDCELLAKLLAAEEPSEAEAARRALVTLRGSEVNQILQQTWDKSSVQAKVSLLEVLLRRRALGAIDLFVRAASDDEVSVRKSAIKGLAELGTEEEVAGMVAGFFKAATRAEQVSVERAIAAVCKKSADESRAEPVLRAREGRSGEEVQMLLVVAGRIGGQSALQAIDDAVESEDEQTHRSGIRALSNWPNAKVADRLIRLIEEDKHQEHRLMALRALLRVAPLPDGRSDEDKLALLKRALELCDRDEERLYGLKRAAAIRLPETLRLAESYLEDSTFAEQACETIVELAHHRWLRDANKEEFMRALDRVMEISRDEIVIDRAKRYKAGQTWVRPKRG